MQLRSPVTVIVTVSPSWQDTRVCLDALKPTLGIRDQVILVEPDGASTTSRHEASWLERFPVPVGTDLDTARTLAAGSARHETVIFLDDDTAPGPHWIEPLVAGLADEAVVAVGPRTTSAIGSQCVEVPAEFNTGAPGLRRFGREWRQAHRRGTSEVTFLTGVCLAMRRADVVAAGAVSTALGRGRKVVAHEVFLPHVAAASCPVPGFDTLHRPLLSANLIVKNEEDVLADCLASLKGLADEVVVYDTGSTDATVAIAERAGAVVIKGFWDDHFGDARNRSLEHCTGHWALWIDADETATGDFEAVRRRLRTASVEGFLVPIENLASGGIGASSVFSPVRLFRTDVARYAGRLHEQVLHREERRGTRADRLADLTLIHSGYLSERVSERDKNSRNLRLAELAVTGEESDGSVDQALALCNLARSQCAVGRYEEARETCRRAATFTENRRNLRTTLHTAAQVEVLSGNPGDAWPWEGRLREVSSTPYMADALAAQILAAQNRSAEALGLIELLPDSAVDEDGKEVRRDALVRTEVRVLTQLGRVDEAVDRLLATLRAGISELHLVAILELLRQADVPVTAVGRGPAPDVLEAVLGSGASGPAEPG